MESSTFVYNNLKLAKNSVGSLYFFWLNYVITLSLVYYMFGNADDNVAASIWQNLDLSRQKCNIKVILEWCHPIWDTSQISIPILCIIYI